MEANFKEIEDNNNLTGRAKKSWKFYEDLEEAIGDSPKVNPAYTYDVADATSPSSYALNVHNSESDEDSDAEDDEIGSTTKRAKTLKRRARKRKSSVAEMLSFLHSYTEKEKVEEEKFNLLRGNEIGKERVSKPVFGCAEK